MLFHFKLLWAAASLYPDVMIHTCLFFCLHVEFNFSFVHKKLCKQIILTIFPVISQGLIFTEMCFCCKTSFSFYLDVNRIFQSDSCICWYCFFFCSLCTFLFLSISAVWVLLLAALPPQLVFLTVDCNMEMIENYSIFTHWRAATVAFFKLVRNLSPRWRLASTNLKSSEPKTDATSAFILPMINHQMHLMNNIWLQFILLIPRVWQMYFPWLTARK